MPKKSDKSDNTEKLPTALHAAVDQAYRDAFDKYVAEWNASNDTNMSDSEVIRFAVAKFINFDYSRSISTRRKRYATDAEREAAKANTQKANTEKFAIRTLFSKLVAALAAKQLTDDMIKLTNEYNNLVGKDGANLVSATHRTKVLDVLKSYAHKYDIKIIERSIKDKDVKSDDDK